MWWRSKHLLLWLVHYTPLADDGSKVFACHSQSLVIIKSIMIDDTLLTNELVLLLAAPLLKIYGQRWRRLIWKGLFPFSKTIVNHHYHYQNLCQTSRIHLALQRRDTPFPGRTVILPVQPSRTGSLNFHTYNIHRCFCYGGTRQSAARVFLLWSSLITPYAPSFCICITAAEKRSLSFPISILPRFRRKSERIKSHLTTAMSGFAWQNCSIAIIDHLPLIMRK